MSDARLRDLERLARQGDPEALKRIARERCRQEGHVVPEVVARHLVAAQAIIDRGDAGVVSTAFRCDGCGEVVAEAKRCTACGRWGRCVCKLREAINRVRAAFAKEGITTPEVPDEDLAAMQGRVLDDTDEA
jgi:hypothetical protein